MYKRSQHFWCTSIAQKCDIYNLYALESAGVIQELTILERKHGLILSTLVYQYLGPEVNSPSLSTSK